MGWTYQRRASGQTDLAFFKGILDHESETAKWELIAGATKSGAFYGAMRWTPKTAEITDVWRNWYVPKTDRSHVFAVICLIRRTNDYYNFGYKDMTETCGPFARQCPARILDMLSDIQPGIGALRHAVEWRKDCRAAIEIQAKRNAANKIGNVIRFDEPVSFGNWGKSSTFEVAKHERKRSKIYIAKDGDLAGQYCRLNRNTFAIRKFTVL